MSEDVWFGGAFVYACLPFISELKEIWRVAKRHSLRCGRGMFTLHAYVSFFVVAALYLVGIATAYRAKPKSFAKELSPLIVSAVTTVVLFLPWLPSFLKQVGDVKSGFWIAPVSPETPAYVTSSFFMGASPWQIKGWVAVLFFVAVASACYALSKTYKKEDNLLYALIFIPICLLVLLSLPPLSSIFQIRYLLVPAFLTSLLVFVKLPDLFAVRKGKVLPVMAALVLLVSFGYGVQRVVRLGNNTDWWPEYFMMADHVNFINEDFKEGDVVVSSSLWTFFDARYYFDQGGLENLRFIKNDDRKTGNLSLVHDRTDLQITVAEFEDLSGRVWLLMSKIAK